MWRRWTLNCATGKESELSLVDDWRHCCCCSWLKRRDTASIGREQAVFPQKTMQTLSFHLMLNTCSSRSESSYFTFDALNLNLIMSLYLTPLFTSFTFFNHVQHNLYRGPTFQLGSCMINVWTCNLYDELALRGVTICVTHKSWVQDASRRVCSDAKQ